MRRNHPLRGLLHAFAVALHRSPALVVLGVLALTVMWGGFAAQTVTVGDDAAVDIPEIAAQERLEQRFGRSEAVVQVLVRATDGRDVRRTDALDAVLAIEDALRGSPVGDRLADGADRPAVLSYLAGAAQVARATNPSDLSDDEVRALQDSALAQAPADVRALLAGLVGSGDPPTTGLVVVFLDVSDVGEAAADEPDPIAAIELEVAEAVAMVPEPPGLSLEPFGFGLLFAESDVGSEVGRLFGTAALVILLVLATVYWVRPTQRHRARVVRRTAADVGLTFAAILVAIVWMQGAGVLLGPDYLGLIGYFTPQTQIVPILLVGLGVDYAIHLTARYRHELAAGALPDEAIATASRTVGVALVLATATTAVGFLTNLVSPVAFLRTFGVLAALGIVAAFVVTLTFVPAARLLLDRRAARRGAIPRSALATQRARLLPQAAARTAVLAERAPAATLVVAVLTGVLGGFGFTQLDSRFSVTDFVPRDAPLRATFETIAEEFDGGLAETTVVLLEGPVATPEAHNALVAVSGELDGVAGVRDAAAVESLVNVLDRLRAEDPALAERLAALGLEPNLRVDADADVAAIYGLLLDEAPDARRVLAATGDTYTALVRLRTTAGEDGAGELAAALDAAFAPVRASGVATAVTSQQIIQAAVRTDIESSQLTSLGVALAAAMLLLVTTFWVTMRRPLLGFVTIAPVGLVLLWTFGAMAATGIPLTPVTATLAALAIGIGLPFTIHVTHRFTELRGAGEDVLGALRATARHTGGALAGSALTTMIGFGVLTTSSLTPFRQLGFVTVYAVGFALLASVLVLPSLLVLWDRWDRRNDPRRTPTGSSATRPAARLVLQQRLGP